MLCYFAEKNKSKQGEKSNAYFSQSSRGMEHTNDNCETCQKYKSVMKGGRPKKERKNGGKSSINSCHGIIQHTKKIEPPLLHHDQDSFTLTTANPQVDLTEEEYTCTICRNPLNYPIHTSCSTLTCAPCLSK